MQFASVAPDHHTAVAELNRVAFGGDAEGKLVSRLREDGLMLVELVAVDDDEVVGHILFSRLTVEVDGRPVLAASLAPMSVQADRQREGIGAALIREGLEALLAQGCQAQGRANLDKEAYPEHIRQAGPRAFLREIAR